MEKKPKVLAFRSSLLPFFCAAPAAEKNRWDRRINYFQRKSQAERRFMRWQYSMHMKCAAYARRQGRKDSLLWISPFLSNNSTRSGKFSLFKKSNWIFLLHRFLFHLPTTTFFLRQGPYFPLDSSHPTALLEDCSPQSRFIPAKKFWFRIEAEIFFLSVVYTHIEYWCCF